MSLFGKLLKTGFDVVTTPIEVVKDLATGGGLVTDREEPYTLEHLKRLEKDGKEIREELDDL